MKLYKLWLEIEEFDSRTGEYRNLVEQGEADPVPVAVFRSLESARSFSEAVAMDRIAVAAHAQHWTSRKVN